VRRILNATVPKLHGDGESGDRDAFSRGSEVAATTKKWVGNVKTVSTYPPEGLFTKDANTIARQPASKKVSPKGPASGMRMLTFYINRAGHGLSASRRVELEKAKKILSRRIQTGKEKKHVKSA